MPSCGWNETHEAQTQTGEREGESLRCGEVLTRPGSTSWSPESPIRSLGQRGLPYQMMMKEFSDHFVALPSCETVNQHRKCVRP